MKPLVIILAVLLVIAWPRIAPAVADAVRVLLAAELAACVLLAAGITRAARSWPWTAVYPWRPA